MPAETSTLKAPTSRDTTGWSTLQTVFKTVAAILGAPLGRFRRSVWVCHGPEPILRPTGHAEFESPRRHTQHWKIVGTRADTNMG
jgi:hypothetical protein